MIYLSLFTISFLAATILPFSSELTLAGLIATSNYDNLLLLVVASFGNVLGSVVNWALGFYSRNFTTKKWFPFKDKQIENSSNGLVNLVNGRYYLPGCQLLEIH